MSQNIDTRPWYREPWTWGLMSGPFIVVVAGFVTAWIAVSGSDDLVADDYYKQGLEVNQRIHRTEEAVSRGIEAELVFGNMEDSGVRVYLKANEGIVLPKKLVLKLVHPLRARFDQTVDLEESGTGFYAGKLSAPVNGKRLVQLESTDGVWRLAENLQLMPGSRIQLSGK